MSAGNKDQLAELARDLTRKIAKAKPVVQLVESGELKTLSAEEQRLVQGYPKWIEDLELVRKGVVPSKTAPTPSPQPQAAPPQTATPPPAVESTPEASPEVNRSARGSARKEKPDLTPKKSEPRLSAHQKHAKMLDEIRQADRKARQGLVDAYLATKVDRTKMQALAKEYDSICQLRRDVLSGKIANPTKMQNNRIGLLPQLEREMELERGQLSKQSVKLRAMLFAELGLEDEPEVEEEEEEEVAPQTQGVAEAEETSTPSEISEGAKVNDEIQPHRNGATESAEEPCARTTEPGCAAADTPEVLSRNGDGSASATPQEEPVTGDGDSLAAEDVAAGRPETESTGMSDAGESAEAQHQPEQTPTESKPEAPRLPSPPKELDWSGVTIQKNRPKPIKRVEGESTSPETTEKVDPTAIAKIVIGSQTKPQAKPSTASAKAEPAPQGKKTEEKKGKGKATDSKSQTPAPPAPAANLLQQSVTQRVQKDFLYCKGNRLPNVRFHPFNDNLLVWHINVSPIDGPLAGCFVHLEMKFGELYPMEPPTIRSFVEVPHSQIFSIDSVKNRLCLEHTVVSGNEDPGPTRGWSPIYTAFSILTQLQSFFGAEAFGEAKKALGASFKSRIMLCRGDLSRFSCSCGHSAATPSPAAPCFNGPFEHPPKGLVASDGAIRCHNRAPIGHHWVHAYSSSGKHKFTVTVEQQGEEGALIGVSTARYNGPAEQIGKHPQSIAVSTLNGQLRNCGFVEEYEGPLTFPLPRFSVIDVTVDLEQNVVRFECGGHLIGEVGELNKFDHWHPAIALLSTDTAVSFVIPVDESGDWQYALPPPPRPEALSEEVHCFVTKATSDEAVLGIGLEVSRGKDFAPSAIRTTGDVLSKDAAERQKQSVWGRRFDVFLPLVLDGAHAARSLPLLKRAISMCCRNPNATLFYEPPFKTEQAVTVLALALQGVVDQCVKEKLQKSGAAFRAYTELVHCLVALAIDVPAIADQAQRALDGGSSSGNILSLSALLLGVPWPQVVQRALSAEWKSLQRTEPAISTEAELFAAIKPRLKHLLVAAAFSHAVRVTTLKKAYDLLLGTKSAPTAEMCEEVSHQLSTVPTVTSWEALEAYLKADVSLADLKS